MMKRSEATRYARWSAAVAIAIAVLAAGVYLHRRQGERVARRKAPPPVPANVEQQSAQFSYSKVVGNRTLFTVRASRATEYKDQHRSALEEVLIAIYGDKGDRRDTIGAHECSYAPVTSQIQCQGEVLIDLRGTSSSGAAAKPGMHLETRDISFDPVTETISTPNDITLQFPDGSGRATGVRYDMKNEVVEFVSNVRLRLQGSRRQRTTQILLSGRSLEYRRSAGWMKLSGPVTAQEGPAKVQAGTLEVHLDSQIMPQQLVASEGVRMTESEGSGAASMTADSVQIKFSAGGVIDRAVANGNVHADRKMATGEESYSARHVEITTIVRNRRVEPRELQANGSVLAEMQQNGATRRLQSSDLRVEFAPGEHGRGVRIQRASTATQGEIIATHAGETDRIRGGKLSAEFDDASHLAELGGTSGVEVTRQSGTNTAEVSSAQNLRISFAGEKNWATIGESGGVKYQQDARTATADRAEIGRSTNEIVLDGDARIADSNWSTSATHIAMNRATGEVHAAGSVVSSYFGAGGTHSIALGTGAAHVSADRLDALNAAGGETYSGHARLWQDNATLNADAIEIWQNQKMVQAQGNVRAVIPEAPDATLKNTTPVLWHISAPSLIFRSNAGAIDLTGGVQAKSDAGAISCEALKLLLASNAQKQQRLGRAIAEGDVRIQARGRVGTANHGEYMSENGKFVLSGGKPMLSDAFGNTTTGRELTFFLANDTILVDSQEGSRTVTKHRIEK